MNDHEAQLTSSEKTRIRGALLSYIAEHPARAPFSIRALDWLTSTADSLFFSRHLRVGTAAVIFLVFSGIGTSYAAESALPGDTLYPIKIDINEKVAAALTGAQSRPQFDAELTARRLEEAEKLAAENKLSPQASAQIKANLSELTGDFSSHIASLTEASSSSDNVAAAADAQSTLEATLSAHAQVLAALSDAVPAASSTLTPIASAVSEHIQAVRESRAHIDDALAASSSTKGKPVAKAAEESQQNAEEALSSVQALVPAVQQSLGGTSSAVVAIKANSVENAVVMGQKHLEQGKYTEALGAFQDAIRAAEQTKVAVDATVQLKKVMPSLPPEAAATTIQIGDFAIPVTLMSATSTTKATTSESTQTDGTSATSTQ